MLGLTKRIADTIVVAVPYHSLGCGKLGFTSWLNSFISWDISLNPRKQYLSGYRIKAITPAFQAGDGGSIPPTRSNQALFAAFLGRISTEQTNR